MTDTEGETEDSHCPDNEVSGIIYWSLGQAIAHLLNVWKVDLHEKSELARDGKRVHL